MIFERDDCRRLLAALPGDTPAHLSFRLDLLIAAAHVGPFLPAADLAAIDRSGCG